MIYDNVDGHVAHRRMRKTYDFEIECKSISSEYSENIKMILAQYRQCSENYENQSVLQENEDFSPDNPSYSFSIYCTRKDLDDMKHELMKQGINIIQILDNFI